ncbi:MAG TPA: zinc-dependent metalloprotease [Longimicrobiales bacterium]|nr:zinc-dependent metalloprotease [Longimicrobiales bacterium]
MISRTMRVLASACALLTSELAGCGAPSAAAEPARAPVPQEAPEGGRGRAAARNGGSEPRDYEDVVTDEAVSEHGLFTVHRVDDDLLFEIPRAQLGREMLLVRRTVESTLQQASAYFGGGADLVVQWEWAGDRVILRQREYDLTADSTRAVWGAVAGFTRGPILGAYDVEAFGPDSALVVDVTDLFLTNVPELAPLENLQSERSWISGAWAFEDAVNVEVVQSGRSAPPGGRGGGPGGGSSSRSQTATLFFSMTPLPDEPMMPRWHDDRVGFNSSRSYDFTRPDNRLEQVRMIHRYRLQKRDPEAEISDPIQPIVFWIDPATPEWLQPWAVKGVEAWRPAFEEAGFSNAIVGRVAPTRQEDPSFSLYDARRSAIYWRPSTVANATGGQIVDPRSGEILKGEVNMYHNVMELVRNWYVIQVGALDARARTLPLPDSLMGRLIEYVVTHEVGHAIGFPHNMKASSTYPVDSLRSRSFLERMGGHTPTLMDYSRFHYVAQPEDHIPVEYLIPRVGPYDRFAVHWGYAPIPGAKTPDDERPTLDAWARQQDDHPWLRFTTADAGDSDPEALTEAVGDADAVQSSTYGMRNLQRVADMLLDIAEKPGESYETLESLYSEAVAQWGRYMGHVTAIVGGAVTQERYGTGPRFEPVSKERQRDAVRYLSETAFHVPEMFLDAQVLRRIEPDGVVDRFRTQQSRVLEALLDQDRLQRLIEFEAMARTPSEAYTLADLMEDLRAGIWGELGEPSVRVSTYRRNLQRAFLDIAAQRLADDDDGGGGGAGGGTDEIPAWASDVRAVLRAELEDLARLAEDALARAADDMTRVHLRDVRAEIERIASPR